MQCNGMGYACADECSVMEWDTPRLMNAVLWNGFCLVMNAVLRRSYAWAAQCGVTEWVTSGLTRMCAAIRTKTLCTDL